MSARDPLVSVVMATRDRPRLLSVALRCYQHQTYPRRELIVVDDGVDHPADESAVVAAGGRLVCAAAGTPLGAKLNLAVAAARGRFCQKMDDDDWYAPSFMATMMAGLLASFRVTCTPTVAFLMPFLFFDVARWEVRRSLDNNAPGATFLFAREDWEERPFRGVQFDEDTWFLLDHLHAGGSYLPISGLETFLAVRHTGSRGERGHTWTHQATGQVMEAHMRERRLYASTPEALLPAWALDVYRELRGELRASSEL